MNIYLESIGCKLNQSEIESMARTLHHAGHRVIYDPVEADICLLNSCAVTQTAARKTRQALRRLTRQAPDAQTFVLGCYVELWPNEIGSIEGAKLLPGGEAKRDILHALGLAVQSSVGPQPGRRRTRAFAKVQDGCNNHCTYCVVRIARGPERSRPLPEILDEIAELAGGGAQEIVLTGVHVGAYGRDLGLDLTDLVRSILDSVDLPRLRLSSIEPWHLDPRFLDLWRDPRLCRHLHLPLQSGCDATLRRMGRRYTTSEIMDLLDQARQRIPDLGVTTDVMVGFPGETDEEFEESLRFVRRAGFSRLHVFRYSRRPGTAAASYPDQAPAGVSVRRSALMQSLGKELSRQFHEGLLGRVFPVLWETRDVTSTMWSGLTDNYARVTRESTADLHNRIELIRLARPGSDGTLLGEPASPEKSI